MPRNSNEARFIVMLELAMAAFGSDVTPAVIFNQFDNLSDFHTCILPHKNIVVVIKPPMQNDEAARG